MNAPEQINPFDYVYFLFTVIIIGSAILNYRLTKDQKRTGIFHLRLEILVTKRDGYNTENICRDRQGLSLAYTEEDYEAIEREMRLLINLFDRGLIPLPPKTLNR